MAGIGFRKHGYVKDDRILRPREAARFLSIAPSTLYGWVASGWLEPPLRIGPRARGWWKSTLQNHAERGREVT